MCGAFALAGWLDLGTHARSTARRPFRRLASQYRAATERGPRKRLAAEGARRVPTPDPDPAYWLVTGLNATTQASSWKCCWADLWSYPTSRDQESRRAQDLNAGAIHAFEAHGDDLTRVNNLQS